MYPQDPIPCDGDAAKVRRVGLVYVGRTSFTVVQSLNRAVRGNKINLEIYYVFMGNVHCDRDRGCSARAGNRNGVCHGLVVGYLKARLPCLHELSGTAASIGTFHSSSIARRQNKIRCVYPRNILAEGHLVYQGLTGGIFVCGAVPLN